MIAPFTLHRPQSLREASSLLSEFRADARVLAGGSELILLLKMGLADASHICGHQENPGFSASGLRRRVRAIKNWAASDSPDFGKIRGRAKLFSAISSCFVFAFEVDGKDPLTIEALAGREGLRSLYLEKTENKPIFLGRG